MEGLPGDLLLRILARLELHDLGKVRCVCRSWRGLIGSREFAQGWEHRDQACAVLRVRPMGAGFEDFYTEVWSPNSSSSGGVAVASGLSPGPPGVRCIGISSSHGLVCGLLVRGSFEDYYNWSGKEWEFVVGNPATNRWKTLPALVLPQLKNVRVEGIQLHAEASWYYLVAAFGDRTDSNQLKSVYLVRQYDSRTGEWSTPVEPFFGARVEFEPEAELRGSLFIHSGLRHPPFFLAAYDPNSAAWSCHQHFKLEDGADDPIPDNALMFGDDDDDEETTVCGVFGWRGKVIFVTDSLKYVVLWELDPEAGEWKVLAKEWYRELYRDVDVEWESLPTHVRSVWRRVQLAGDTMVFTCDFSPGYNPGVYAPIAYDLLNCRWHTLNRYGFKGADAEAAFTFVPSFIAQP